MINRMLQDVLATLTVDSVIEVDRRNGLVLVNGEMAADFGPPEHPGYGPMEDYADTLWTHVEDLKAAKAGWSL